MDKDQATNLLNKAKDFLVELENLAEQYAQDFRVLNLVHSLQNNISAVKQSLERHIAFLTESKPTTSSSETPTE